MRASGTGFAGATWATPTTPDSADNVATPTTLDNADNVVSATQRRQRWSTPDPERAVAIPAAIMEEGPCAKPGDISPFGLEVVTLPVVP